MLQGFYNFICRMQIKKMSETKKEEKNRLVDADATRGEDQVETLRKQVANHKQEETWTSDKDVTGLACKDMQDQISHIIQQLR